MKKILFACLLSLFTSAIFAQAYSEISVCTNITVTLLNQKANAINEPASYLLEKEIIPGAWKKTSTQISAEAQINFIDLLDGVYRVSVITKKKDTKHGTVLHKNIRGTKAKDNNIDEKVNVFVSNEIIIDSEKCGGKTKSSAILKTLISEESKIILGPNPANTFINCTILNKDVTEFQIQIYDISGQLVMSSIKNSGNSKIDVSNLKTGIYFIQCLNSKEILATNKIVIVR